MTQNNGLRPVVLLHLTDMHLHAAADSRMRGVATYETFLAVLEQVQRDTRWPPDAIVVTGDIVQDESRAGYERFRATLERFKIPVYCLPGNHDDPQLMSEVLADAPFQVCGDTNLADWILIFLSTFSAGDDGGRLGTDTLADLDARLSANVDRHALICMHHQPLPMGSAWLDGAGLRDADEFLACIERHSQVRAVLWGHVHQASDRLRDGVRYLSSPSTCAQFLPDNDSFALDSRPPGMRWLSLGADGEIQSEIGWLEAEGAP
ncbi:MAG: metallophosphoesterase [Candidatus Rariloculaceae bacterium]